MELGMGMEMEMEMVMDFLGSRTPPRPAATTSTTRVVDGVLLGAPPVAAANLAACQSTIPVSFLQAFQGTIPTSYLQGSEVGVRNAASTTTPRWSSAPLTIVYAGSVHVFDNVSREHAEQIMLMAATAAQAGSPPVGLTMLQPESTALPHETQMAAAKACSDPMRLSPDTVSQAVFMPTDVPLARNASLALFLERRKQRVARPATPYSRWERSPGKTDTVSMVSRRSTEPFGNAEQSWVLANAKDMDGSRDEEALDTELKI